MDRWIVLNGIQQQSQMKMNQLQISFQSLLTQTMEVEKISGKQTDRHCWKIRVRAQF